MHLLEMYCRETTKVEGEVGAPPHDVLHINRKLMTLGRHLEHFGGALAGLQGHLECFYLDAS